MINPKLSSSVSIVKLDENTIEFFKSNTRKQIKIKVNDGTILSIVNHLDGNLSIKEITEKYNLDENELLKLLSFLKANGILDSIQPENDFIDYNKFRRIINFLNDYSTSHDHLLKMWNKLRNSHVLIIGLGAVGTWVATNLIESGVSNIYLMDPDFVEISNLHRQFGFEEQDIGKLKTEAFTNRIFKFRNDVNVIQYNEYLSENSLDFFDKYKLDLIINCADKPTVDVTSLIVGEYAMKRNIPHIIGGGYNFHLSLIGQTVIPFETACVKCFEKTLNETNYVNPKRVKKLAIKNRKIGSFGPMCSIIASFIGMDSIKILSGCCKPANINRRGELDIYSMNIKYNNFERREDCEWCGKKGIFRNKRCSNK